MAKQRPAPCPCCHHPNVPAAKFCGQCGNELEAEGPAPAGGYSQDQLEEAVEKGVKKALSEAKDKDGESSFFYDDPDLP